MLYERVGELSFWMIFRVVFIHIEQFSYSYLDKPDGVMKILVIEDSADFRDALSLMFEMEGFETRSAGDGQEGFAVAQTEHPDLIISDLNMPDNMDGTELVKHMREVPDSAATPILLYTRLSVTDTKSVIHAGATKVFFKPLDIEQMINYVADFFTQANEVVRWWLLLRRYQKDGIFSSLSNTEQP